MKPPAVAFVRVNDRRGAHPFLRETNVSGVYPPLGLAYLAAAARDAGFGAAIVDAHALDLTVDEKVARIIGSGATLAGLAATTFNWPLVAALARCLRAAAPGMQIFVGGPQLSLYPDECLNERAIDAAVVGEGEDAVVELLQRTASGADWRGVPGVIARDGDALSRGPAREPIANLDRLPMPALDLLPRRRYRALAVAFPFAALVGSRGCPYHCGYCSQVYAGGAYREHSAARVVAEMERAVRQFGAREIVFFDESFTVNQRRVREICSLLLAKPWRVAFNVRTRADLLERETLVALRDAGCRGVHVGVESGSPRVQALMNKNLDLARTAATLAEARALGLETRGYFMLGYPGETRAEIDETLRFALTTPLDWASFTIVTPHPGTGIYQDALADGRFTADYWREYTLGRATRAPQPFTSPEYDEGTLERLLREVYRRFYLRPGLLTRKLFSRRTWGQAAGWLATLWALRRRRGRDRTALA